MVEHDGSQHAKGDGDERYRIGMDVESLADEGDTEAYRTVKVNI